MLLRIGLILFLCWTNPLLAAGPETISHITFEGKLTIPETELRAVLGLKEGKPANATQVEQSVTNLKKWGRLSQVALKQERGRDGLHLTYVLEEGLLEGLYISKCCF